MKFDQKDQSVWPNPFQDVIAWSDECGYTVANFRLDDDENPVFANLYDRVSDAEDADYNLVTGEIQWWELPTLD